MYESIPIRYFWPNCHYFLLLVNWQGRLFSGRGPRPTVSCQVGKLTRGGRIRTRNVHVQTPKPHPLDHRQTTAFEQCAAKFEYQIKRTVDSHLLRLQTSVLFKSTLLKHDLALREQGDLTVRTESKTSKISSENCLVTFWPSCTCSDSLLGTSYFPSYQIDPFGHCKVSVPLNGAKCSQTETSPNQNKTNSHISTILKCAAN